MLSFVFLIIQFFSCKDTPVPVPDWADPELWSIWVSCADSACTSKVIQQQFKVDRNKVGNWINILESSEQQILQLNKLQTLHPGRVKDVCVTLTQAAVRKKCKESAARPHLYAKGGIPKQRRALKKRTSGPEASLVLLPMVSSSPLTEVSPNKVDCSKDGDPRSCLQRKAKDEAQKGNSIAAASYCQAISTQHIRWRWECHFAVAEIFVSNSQQNYATAAAHCSVAQEYSGRCIVSLHHRLAQLTPPANSKKEGWKEILSLASQIEEYWKTSGKALQQEILASFWGAVLLKSYQKTLELTGDPLDYLPKASHPHIYSAVAFSYINRSTEVLTLDQLIAELIAIVHKRKPSKTKSTNKVEILSINDFWMHDEPKDVDIPAVGYLGRSRRAFSSELEEELTICLLEAMARQDVSKWLPLLKEQKSSSLPMAQWTARRLEERLKHSIPTTPKSP
jgi:hypothetical protein